MPKKRRREKIPTPSWERSGGGIRAQVAQRSPKFWGAVGIGLIVAVAVLLVGVGFLSDYIGDQRRPGSTAIRVEDTNYTVRYYTERLRRYVDSFGGPTSQLAGFQQAMPRVSEDLIEEAIMLRFAAEEGIEVTEDETNANIAARLGIPADDPDLEARLDEELNRSGLTRDEFRLMAETAVLRTKFNEMFEAQIPETLESINYSQILVNTQPEADEIIAEIEAGADFAEIARERSQDTGSAEEGGVVGWAPRGVLSQSLEDTLFGLEIGALVSVPLGSDAVWVYTVTERDPARPVEDRFKARLAEQGLNEWIRERRGGLNIVNHMDLGTGDSDKVGYALRQVYPHLFG